MLANPAAKATSPIGSAVVSISIRAVWARCARARASGPGAELGEQLSLELPGAVAEACGQAGHAIAVDDAVGDQAHRPGHDVGAHVPLGRARAGVGPAALARPEPGLLGGGGGGIEAHVLRLAAGRPGSSAGSRCRS